MARRADAGRSTISRPGAPACRRSGIIRQRFQWCQVNIRADELPPDAKEYGDLELYLRTQNQGLKISVPGASGRHRERRVSMISPPGASAGRGGDRRRDGRRLAAARALAQQRLTQDELLKFDRARQRHAAACRRHPRAIDAGLFPRAVGQSRRRRGEGPAAACQRRGFSQAVRHSGALGRGLRAELGGFRGAGAQATAGSAGSTGSRPWSRRCAPTRGAERVLLLDGGDTWQGSLDRQPHAAARTWSIA